MNISGIFGMLFAEQMEGRMNDLNALKEVIRQYYDLWNAKTLTHSETPRSDAVQCVELTGEKTMETPGATAGAVWADFDVNQFVKETLTPFGGTPEERTIFGAIRPKLAIVATTFAIAATFGFRISKATHLGYSH